MKSSLKWKPATTKFPNDHICSSKAREVGILGFKPEYENAKHVNMNFILSNEYMRLWFKERAIYEKDNYAKQEKARNDAGLKRGFVQRMMVNPTLKTREMKIIKLKRFENIGARTVSRRGEAGICDRYGKTFFKPTKLERYKVNCPQKPKAEKSKTENDGKKKSPAKKTEKESDEKEKKENGLDELGAGPRHRHCHFVCKVINKC